MFRDFQAVQGLANGPHYRTAQRRGLRIEGKFYDLHFRLQPGTVETGGFMSDYTYSLGQELASLDFVVMQDFVVALFRALSNLDVVGDPANVVESGSIFFASESTDHSLFQALRNTIMSVILNNYMSKFLTL